MKNLVENMFSAVMNLRKSSDEVNLKKFVSKVDSHLNKYIDIKKSRLKELKSDLAERKEEKISETNEAILNIDDDRISTVELRNNYVPLFVKKALDAIEAEEKDIANKEQEVEDIKEQIETTEKLIERLSNLGAATK